MSIPNDDREGATMVDALRRSFERWRDRLLGSDGLQGCDRSELERIARELGMSAADLTALAAQGPGSADLLYRRMAVLGLDNADVERVSGALMQDLQRTCSCCDSRSTCAKELAAQPDADDWKAYCPNVVSLESLQKLKGRFPA